MKNMLLMDGSRLFRSRGFYVIILVSLVLLAIFATAAYFVTGFAQELMDRPLPTGLVDGNMLQQARRMMNISFFASFYLSHNNLLHLLLALFAAGFIAKDHQSGYLKNLLGIRHMRQKWLLSKYLIMLLAAIIFYGVFLLGCLVVVLLYGNSPAFHWAALAQYMGLHLTVDLALLAIISLIVCLVQGRTAAVILALLVTLNVQTILYLLIDSLNLLPFKLREWGLMAQASRLGLEGGIISLMGQDAATKPTQLLPVSLGLCLAGMLLSLWAIRRVDYKG